MKLYEDEYLTFDMYFASVCSMQYHPGAGTKEHKKLSIEECKNVAISMIYARREAIMKQNPKVVGE